MKEGKTRIVAVVDEELKQKLQRIAESDKRSLSSLVNFVLEAYIKKNAGKSS
jgi:predicted transcriptional regulator